MIVDGYSAAIEDMGNVAAAKRLDSQMRCLQAILMASPPPCPVPDYLAYYFSSPLGQTIASGAKHVLSASCEHDL